ncbi:MAG: type IX secretion system membrane protein PorP/SprF [Pedobacter sp.]|nr:MAG: type IX secretion system membrane protein PorP/SprF [Pedobacter sp.]
MQKYIYQAGRFFMLSVTGLLLFIADAKAQLQPLNAQYFQNLYLANPAMAGYGKGLNINESFRKQWSNVPGGPLTQAVTVDQQLGKIGLGATFYSERAGSLQHTKAVATFAYHLPLNDDDQKLNFGVSFGGSKDKFDLSELKNGDASDPLIARFNERGFYADGDFGASYTDRRLTVEAALPNMRALFRNDDLNAADKPTFYAAAGYKLNLGQGVDAINLEPKVAVRGVKNYKNLWDAGVNARFAEDKLYLMAMYHSTENATFGLGVNYKSSLYIMAYYNTVTSALRTYSAGDFEINIRLNLGKK